MLWLQITGQTTVAEVVEDVATRKALPKDNYALYLVLGDSESHRVLSFSEKLLAAQCSAGTDCFLCLKPNTFADTLGQYVSILIQINSHVKLVMKLAICGGVGMKIYSGDVYSILCSSTLWVRACLWCCMSERRRNGGNTRALSEITALFSLRTQRYILVSPSPTQATTFTYFGETVMVVAWKRLLTKKDVVHISLFFPSVSQWIFQSQREWPWHFCWYWEE